MDGWMIMRLMRKKIYCYNEDIEENYMLRGYTQSE